MHVLPNGGAGAMAKIGVLDKQLAHILRQHRTINLDGVTQADIAKRAKYDNTQMVSYLETARHPIPRDHRNRERIARAYQLDITEFCRWCLLAEMERDGMPADLLLHIASQPILGPNGEGPRPPRPGGPRDPGCPDPERPVTRRPNIVFADPDDHGGTGTVYHMPNPGLIRDILLTLSKHIVVDPITDPDDADQPIRNRSALACQATRSRLIMYIRALKQKIADANGAVFSDGWAPLHATGRK